VKMLGRSIGYKALETRLKQMWVRNGVLNIVDLSNDYYLVTFSNKQDQEHALLEGPWLIYDHYLTVREWSPNFNPATDAIQKVAVWVRFSGLPIEYYDAKVLSFIGDRIGRTVKVDKNTLTRERGKYARLCVEVDLRKPLLAMFTIKGRQYNVEYEGLHFLCTTCGKFGHYKEGCPDKLKEKDVDNRGQGDENGVQKTAAAEASGGDGPWMVVQKPRRPRKPTGNNGAGKTQAMINDGAKIVGSRFTALNDESPLPENGDPKIIADGFRDPSSSIKGRSLNVNKVANDYVNQNKKNLTKVKGGIGGTKTFKAKSASNNEKVIKGSSLGNKGKGGAFFKRDAADKLAELLDTNRMGEYIGAHFKTGLNDETRGITLEVTQAKEVKIGENGGEPNKLWISTNGPEGVEQPNRPRPPNLQTTPPIVSVPLNAQKGHEAIEGEDFEDANDHGATESEDSEMEVEETRGLGL
jgi:hypothetical protein